MKLATFYAAGAARVGVVVEEEIYDLAACATANGITVSDSVQGILAGGPAAFDAARQAVAWAQSQGDGSQSMPLAEVTLGPPLPQPGKLFCLAGNYASHIMEGGGSFAGKEKMTPHFFLKPWTTIIATNQAIRIPPASTFTDWELELAVVIGKQGRDIPAEEAQSYIAGYTIFNDISARELAYRQNLEAQSGDKFFDWLIGKWPDTFGPMGPWLTTADEIPHPDRLAMKLWLNGELHQNASTGQMVFSPAEVIALISQFVTLHPGDVISTGTPAGVGHTKKLQLKPGDTIRGEIEGLGVLVNSVEAL
jgi:2,4-didehydro-3-deoxy-L-rhamnonate hydrolase